MKTKYILFSFLAFGISTQTKSQIVSEANLSVTIESNIIVSANSTWTNNGSIQNEGSVELTSGDWNNTNLYGGAGTITLSDVVNQNFGHNDQDVAILIFANSDKTISSGAKVTSQLNMPSGLVNTSVGNDLIIGSGGAIAAFGPTQFINGPLFHEGTGLKTFPIGTNGNFYPTNLDNVQGTNPIVGLQVTEINPNNNTELPLESISSLRFWRLTELTSGQFVGSSITLPVINESGLTNFARVVVGQASDAELIFRNLGQSATTGNATNGTVTSAGLATSELYAVGSRLALASTVDSLALVTLYDQVGGIDWIDDTNWKQDFLTTWSGVTLDSDGNVTGLDLNNNNVIGDIPSDLASVSGLQSLDLSNNEILTIPDLSGIAGLNNPDVRNNRLQFGSLESNRFITGINYSPQNLVLDSVDVLEQINATINIDRTITGTSNNYSWFKNGTLIAGQTNPTLTLPTIQFVDEGRYNVQVSNPLLPLLTLTSTNHFLKISSLERDKIALETIYNATDGSNWTNNTNWLSDDISTWFGVSVANNRVTRLELPANNLEGNMPIDLRDVGEMQIVDLRNNSLRQFPDITRQAAVLQTVDVGNNRLGFGDLEPNLALNQFIYLPQRRFGVTLNERVQVGEDFTMAIEISGSNNQYQWFFKKRKTPEEVPGDPITGANSAEYLIDSVNFNNMGIYYVEVTNSVVTDLTIRNRNQNVFAVTDIFGKALIDPETGSVMNDGDIIAFEIEDPGKPFTPFDTVAFENNGDYVFNDVVLGDYILLARPGPSFMEDVLQTYFSSTNDWVRADTLFLRTVESADINMIFIPQPFDPVVSDALIGGFIVADLPDPVDPEEGLRKSARRRVRRAGCSLLRSRAKNRVLQDSLILVAYTETNDEGEFNFPNVPPGNYFLNIQFPGIPMDTTTLIEFKIDANMEEQSFDVAALVTELGISLELIEETGFYRKYFKNLAVYPNPADRYITIDYEKLNSEDIEVYMTDLTGHRLQTATIDHGRNKKINFDTSRLNNGIYILVFVNKADALLPVASYRIIVDR